MKRLLILMAVLMIVGTATAELLGIKGSYEGNRPDTDFNNTGVINDYTTTLTLKIYVDESGNLTGGLTSYDKMATPVPPTLLLFGSGLLGFILFKRRRKVNT